MYYKVVTKDMKSLGLRKNPNIMSFVPSVWVDEPNPTVGSGGWGGTGGIWVANGLGAARGLKRYLDKKGMTDCRIFSAEIEDILFSNSYRTKTNRVKLLKEIHEGHS